MLRTTEIKSIMRKLREDSQAAEVKADESEVKNESLITNEADEVDSENDVSQSDLLLARLEDIISRFEKALAIVDDEDADAESGEEASAEDENAEDENAEEDAVPEEEESAEESEPEEEEATEEESYERSLEDRLAALERRFTESRRRKACRRLRY